MVAVDVGEVIERVRGYFRRRGVALDLAEEVVGVIFGELRRQHRGRVEAGLVRARRRGGGRVGARLKLDARGRAALLADGAAVLPSGERVYSYAELGERYGLSVSSVGRYLRGEV